MIPPARDGFAHVTDWIFDVDNTLYPRTSNLFAQVDRLITGYVMEVTQLDFDAARLQQKAWYRDHGTTLRGLMHVHGVDPDHFLSIVHDIDYSPVAAHPELVDTIRALPGRKFILTNADTGHAAAVLARLGGSEDMFDGIVDIRAMKYSPKPTPEAYAALLEGHGIAPDRAAMFDDLEKNLVVPHESGMRTVQVVAPEDYVHDQIEAWELARTADAPHIHHRTDDLFGFLSALR